MLVDELIGVLDLKFGVEIEVLFNELYCEGCIIIVVIYDNELVKCIKWIVIIWDG